MNAPFKADPTRTAIALAVTNAAFIADTVMPRVSVGAEEFTYTEYNTQERFTIPDTKIDRKGSFNEVEFTGEEKAAMTSDYGLADKIPAKDLEAAQRSGFDPRGRAVELLTELVMLGREKRVAGLVHNLGSYDANLRETLAAGDKWTAATGDPIEQITAALEQPLMRPNTMTLNGAGLLALRRNAAIVKAYHGNTGDDGLVPVAFLEDMFELNIIAGRARYSAANPGQAMSLEYLWKGDCAMTYVNPQAMPNMGVTFGLTAEYGNRIAMSREVDMGLRGGEEHRVGESVKELILSKDCAYYIEGVI